MSSKKCSHIYRFDSSCLEDVITFPSTEVNELIFWSKTQNQIKTQRHE